jgi:hypothetical protein
MNDRGQSLGGGATLPRSRIAVLFLVLLTAACAPVMLEFHRPSAPGGKVVRAGCPPDKFILFERHDVTIGTSTGVASKGLVGGVVTFEVPEGRVVLLLDQEVEVSASSRGTSKGRLTPGTVWAPGSFQPRDAQPDKPLMGITSKHRIAWWPFSAAPTPYGHSRHAYYSFKFSVSLAEAEVSEAYVLKLPKFSVNDIVVELPPITFIQDREFAIVGLNC